MKLHDTVRAALEAVLSNTWAVELPQRPTWPALVFDIESEPEDGWCIGGDYYQHDVTVLILSRSLVETLDYRPQVKAAMEAIEGYIYDGDHGDADYEDDPELYAYFMNFRIRTKDF